MYISAKLWCHNQRQFATFHQNNLSKSKFSSTSRHIVFSMGTMGTFREQDRKLAGARSQRKGYVNERGAGDPSVLTGSTFIQRSMTAVNNRRTCVLKKNQNDNKPASISGNLYISDWWIGSWTTGEPVLNTVESSIQIIQ